jgi:copper chaperone CopZ
MRSRAPWRLLLAGLLFGCAGEGTASPESAPVEAVSEAPAPPAGSQRVTLTIEGVVCESCAAAVQQSLESAPGVSFAEVDLASGTAVAVFDPAETSVETLASRLEAVDRGRAPPIRVVESALDYRD